MEKQNLIIISHWSICFQAEVINTHKYHWIKHFFFQDVFNYWGTDKEILCVSLTLWQHWQWSCCSRSHMSCSQGCWNIVCNIFWKISIDIFYNIGCALVGHSLEIWGLCLMKWSGKMLQNMPYFRYMKTQNCFFNFPSLAILIFPLMNACSGLWENIEVHSSKWKK